MITRLRAAILCDDVRTEDNGKNIFVGVYGNQIITGVRPAIIAGFLVLMLDADAEENKVDLRVSAITERTQTLMLKATGGLVTLITPLQIALVDEKPLRVAVRNEGSETWLDCGEWQMTFAENAAEAPPEFAEQIYQWVATAKEELSQQSVAPNSLAARPL